MDSSVMVALFLRYRFFFDYCLIRQVLTVITPPDMAGLVEEAFQGQQVLLPVVHDEDGRSCPAVLRPVSVQSILR
jgi:hypothetical protein